MVHSWMDFTRVDCSVCFCTMFLRSKMDIPGKQEGAFQSSQSRNRNRQRCSPRSQKPQDQPIAVRMSWVSNRQTKRIEDMAYCLLGIFNINMPMLYGEGEKAFLRLQEEIIKQSADMSIFAWKSEGRQEFMGLLASSPALFRGMGKLKFQSDHLQLREYLVTNRGIRFNIRLPLHPATGCFLLPMNHGYEEKENRCVLIRQVGMDLCVRIHPDRLVRMPAHRTDGGTSLPPAQSSHAKTLSLEDSVTIGQRVLIMPDLAYNLLNTTSVVPYGSWNSNQDRLYAGHMGNFFGYMHIKGSWSEEFDSFVIVCYFAENLWKYTLVRGDIWKTMEPHYTTIFSDGNGLRHKGSKLRLPHLWQQHQAKKIVASLETAAPGSPTTTLNLEVLHDEL